jgi:hypothetical protein
MRRREREHHRRFAMTVVAVAAVMSGSVCSLAMAAPRVRCHVDYGGEVRRIEARPVASPLAVAPVEVGSYFRFRLVLLQASGLPDEVRVETFSDRDDGPVLIHQGRYPVPRRAGGFTGHQTVYEPVRDGELQYWCEWRNTR